MNVHAAQWFGSGVLVGALAATTAIVLYERKANDNDYARHERRRLI